MTNPGISGPSTPGSSLAGLTDLSTASYGSQVAYNPATNRYVTRKGPRFNPAVHGYNLTPDIYLKWRTALANVRTGISDAKLIHVGDSTTSGVSGGAAANTSTAFPARLTTQLNSYVCPANEVVPGWGATTGSGTDTRVVYGAGWSGNSGFFGAGYTAGTGASGTLLVTPYTPFDTITIYYARNPGQGTSAINVDGGTTLGNIVTSGTPQAIGTATFTVTLGTHTINIAPPTVGNIQIQMIVTSTSTVKSVLVHNLGVSGSTATSWMNTTAAAWSLTKWVPFLAPDLTTIELTINDNIAQTNLATYTTWMKAIITQAQATGDVLLVRGVRNQTLQENADYADKQTAILYGLAEDNNCGLLDLALRYGTAPIFGSGGVHFSAVGYMDKAASYFNALRIIS